MECKALRKTEPETWPSPSLPRSFMLLCFGNVLQFRKRERAAVPRRLALPPSAAHSVVRLRVRFRVQGTTPSLPLSVFPAKLFPFPLSCAIFISANFKGGAGWKGPFPLHFAITLAACFLLQTVPMWGATVLNNVNVTYHHKRMIPRLNKSSSTFITAANLLNSSYDDGSAKACAIVETASNANANNEISAVDSEDRRALITSSADRSQYGAPGETETWILGVSIILTG